LLRIRFPPIEETSPNIFLIILIARKISLDVEHNGVKVKLIDYKPSVVEQLVEDENGSEVILLKVSGEVLERI